MVRVVVVFIKVWHFTGTGSHDYLSAIEKYNNTEQYGWLDSLKNGTQPKENKAHFNQVHIL